MTFTRKLMVAAVAVTVSIGCGIAVAAANSGSASAPADDETPTTATLPAPPDVVPSEVPIVDENGDLVRNPDGSLKLYSTELPPLATPEGPDVTYPESEPAGEQRFDQGAGQLVADQ